MEVSQQTDKHPIPAFTSKVLKIGSCGFGGLTSSMAKSALGVAHSMSMYSELERENEVRKATQNMEQRLQQAYKRFFYSL